MKNGDGNNARNNSKRVSPALWGIIAVATITAVLVGTGWGPFALFRGPVWPEDADDGAFEAHQPDLLQLSQSEPVEFDLVSEPLDTEAESEGVSSAQDEDIANDGDRAHVNTLSADAESGTDSRADSQSPSVSNPQSDSVDELTVQAQDLPGLSFTEMAWPVSGEITRPFGWYRYPALGEWSYSGGVTFSAREDDKVVRAALPGRVQDVINENGNWRLRISHADGYTTEYAGLEEVDVTSFQVVAAGDSIGKSGDVNERSVTFTMRRGDEAIDPTDWLVSPVTTDHTGENTSDRDDDEGGTQ